MNNKKQNKKPTDKVQGSLTANVVPASLVVLTSPQFGQSFVLLLKPYGQINQQLILSYLKELSLGQVVKRGQVLTYTLCGKRNNVKVLDGAPTSADEWIIDSTTVFEAKKEEAQPFMQTAIQASHKLYGLDAQLEKLSKIIECGLGKRRQYLEERRFIPVKGVLVVGQSGVGKSTLLKNLQAIHSSLFNVIYLPMNQQATSLLLTIQQAIESQPALMLVDDIQFIKTDDTLSRDLAICFERISGAQVLIVGATLSLKGFDESLRRSGRFEKEVQLEIPNQNERCSIFGQMAADLEYPASLNLDEIKELCFQMSGFTINDIKSVLREGLEYEPITKESLQSVLKQINPSGIKDLLMDIPSVKWTDIGGYENVKDEIRRVIEWPLKHPEAFQHLGVQPSKGILLYGPPGCCKTLLARAICTKCNLAFMAVKGPELFSKYVGDSEKAIRDIFRKARMCAPCVIFFDEIDAIAPQRSNSTDVADRVLIQLLTEMDGFDTLKNVIIVAATNRPSAIDKALLRPGRFDHLIYVDLPDEYNRSEIFKVNFGRMRVSQEVVDSLKHLVDRTRGYTGAEICQICKEAGMSALIRDINSQHIGLQDFENAIFKIHPRVTNLMIEYFKNFQENQKQ